MNDFLPGRSIVRANIAGTAMFTLSSGFAAIVFDGWVKVQGVVVALGLFTAGVIAFLWGYWAAVQRSRRDELAVAEIYFLLGPAIPQRVKRMMNSCLVVQTLVALATALSRPSTPAEAGATGGSTAGSTLAFGVLVPVLGLGLNGLWAALHGRFPPRRISVG
ncbi:MAG: hypothetical protein ACO2Y7_03355 [Ilumatobacteraceae bacterium]